MSNELFENCPNCGRTYDEIDYDYQICSLCGHSAEYFELCKFYNSKQYDLVNRLRSVTKGIHYAKGYKYSFHVSGKIYQLVTAKCCHE